MSWRPSGLVLLLVFAAAAQAAPRSTWDGVYSPVQALRGQLLYSEHCQRCHRANLSAFGGVLIGAYFMESWRDEPLQNVFRLIREQMPRDRPGSLTDQQYVDLLAYVLEFNRFPSGMGELSESDLSEVLVAGKEGPNAILEFGSLVTVTGCLVRDAAQEWTVLRGSEPLRTNDPEDSTAAAIVAARSRQPFGQIYRLQDAGFFHPERSRGRRVEAKGFLTRQPNGGKLFVTSIQTIGEPCTSDGR